MYITEIMEHSSFEVDDLCAMFPIFDREDIVF